jgi:hypothetical protein
MIYGMRKEKQDVRGGRLGNVQDASTVKIGLLIHNRSFNLGPFCPGEVGAYRPRGSLYMPVRFLLLMVLFK